VFICLYNVIIVHFDPFSVHVIYVIVLFYGYIIFLTLIVQYCVYDAVIWQYCFSAVLW